MAKPWAEVANSEGYKALAPEQQEVARNQYFDQVVAPRAPQDKLEAVRAQFDSATKSQPIQSDQPSLEQEMAATQASALAQGQVSPDGSRVIRDDGTTIPLGSAPEQGFLASQQQAQKPKLQLPPKAPPRIPMPTNWQVARNAVAKGVAGIPDMIGNVIPSAVNLATAAGGAGLYEAGLIDSPPDLPLENPDMFRKTGEAIGAINPEYNPQTTGQRVLDTAVQSATGGILTGGSGGLKTALSSGLGGAVGGGTSQSATELGAPPIVSIPLGVLAGGGTAAATNRATGATVNAAAQNQNAVVDAGFQKARDAGFTIPASQSNPNSLLANTVDVIAGGRPKMQQAASIKNQKVVNEKVATELGLPKDTPITPDVLKIIRSEAANRGYDPVKNAGKITVRPEYDVALDKLTEQSRKAKAGFAGYDDAGLEKTINSFRTKEFDADSGVSMTRQLREDASRAYAQGDKNLGKALRGASNAIEDEIEAHLAAQGNKTALNDFRESRKVMAKTFSIEKALNEATGDISATKLARQLDKGAPLSGELKDIALAAKLPGASLADTKYATTGASQLELMGGVGAAVGTGNPLFAALPFVRGGTRMAALSRPVSNALGTPNYKKFGLKQQNKNAMMIGAGLDAERQNER